VALGALRGLVGRRRLVESLLVLFGLSITEGAGILMLLPLLDGVGVGSGTGATGRARQIFDSASAAVGLPATLATALAVYVVGVAVHSVFQRRHAVLSLHLEQDVVRMLRRRLHHAISGLEWPSFVRMRSSDLLHALTDGSQRSGTAAYYAMDLAGAAAAASVYVAIAARMSPGVTAGVVLTSACLALAFQSRFEAARQTGRHGAEAAARLYGTIAEHLSGMKTAISYGAVARHSAAFDDLAGDVYAARVEASRQYASFRQVLMVGSAAGVAVVVYVSSEVLAVATADLLVLLLVFARLMPRVTGLYEKTQLLAAQLPALRATLDLERRCLEARRSDADDQLPLPFSRELRLVNLSFSYITNGGVAALHDVSLTVRWGATTAIVGPSGAGKSTIADLLLGLLVPTSGSVLVDDVVMTPAHAVRWRERIGYVGQDTFLFHDTIRANLLWARPGASDEELWLALASAAADRFVAALPDGLETVVGDRGVLLSGGERQRLALARALLRRPALLILDEATSALDSENERAIQEALQRLHGRLTVVMITHRLSAVRNADAVYVLDSGKVVESGRWDDLLQRSEGRLRALYAGQGAGAIESRGA